MSGREMASFLHQHVLKGMLEEISRACQKDGVSYCSSLAVKGPTGGHAIVMDQLVLAVEFSRGSDWRPQEATIRSIVNQYLAEPGWRGPVAAIGKPMSANPPSLTFCASDSWRTAYPSISHASGSPRVRSRTALRPSTSSKCAGARPLPGRTDRTLARLSA